MVRLDDERFAVVEGGKSGLDLIEEATGETIELKPQKAPQFVKGWTTRNVPLPRKWIYDRLLIRKFVSAIGARGGTGKTQFGLTIAIGMAIGVDLLNGGEPIPRRRVLYANLEDPADEFTRRVLGILKKHDVNQSELNGWFFEVCGRETPLKLVGEGRDGPQLDEAIFETLIEYTQKNKVDAILVDPFVSSHSVSENSNESQDLVVKSWCRIADQTNAAILLIHHLRKAGSGDTVDANAMRGGGALVDGVRALWMLGKMSAETAVEMNVPEDERGRFFSVDKSGKNNLTLQSGKLSWYRMDSVCLNNEDGEDDADWIGVPEPWNAPKLTDLIDNAGQIVEVQRLISVSNEKRYHDQSNDWVGHPVAQVLNLDASSKSGKRKVKQIVDMWIAEGALKIDIRDHPKKKNATCKYVVSGVSATPKNT